MDMVRAPAGATVSADVMVERREREAVTAVQIRNLFDVGRLENSRSLAILADPDNMGKRITITTDDCGYQFRIETFAGNRGAAAQQLLQTDVLEFGWRGEFRSAAQMPRVVHEPLIAQAIRPEQEKSEAAARQTINFLHGRFAVDVQPLASVSMGESLRQIAAREALGE